MTAIGQEIGASEITPAPGQLWREVDPRKERYVQVIGISQPSGKIVFLRTCARNGDLPKGSRISESKRERFNGKHGGYEFVGFV